LFLSSEHGVVYIKYATVLLQKMSLEMDESFVIALVGFTKFSGASWNRDHVKYVTVDLVLVLDQHGN
jgi:vacuolar protein sorting-associated protein 13A/C